MSAYIVDRAHIDAIVLAAVQWRVIARPTPERLTELGRKLWAENLASVRARYPEDRDGMRPGPLDFRDSDVETYVAPTAEVLLAAVPMIKALDCYEYQSCEHAGWKTSEAATWLGHLRTAIMETTPEAGRHFRRGRLYPAGYDSARGWDVTMLDEVVAQ